mgnify:CR=1 FL=1
MNTTELKDVVLSKVPADQQAELKLQLEKPEVEEAFEKLVSLSSNQEFLAKAINAKDSAELQKLASENGIELDDAGAEAAFENIRKDCSTELTEADLDQVAGGVIVEMALIGLFGGIAIGIIATYAWYAYRKATRTCK